MTGLPRDKVIGRKVTEVLPGIENSDFNWIDTYGKVALDGETEENFNLIEDLQIHYLELTKLSEEKDIAHMNALELWLTFIKEAGQQGSEERLKQIIERSAIIKMATERLE